MAMCPAGQWLSFASAVFVHAAEPQIPGRVPGHFHHGWRPLADEPARRTQPGAGPAPERTITFQAGGQDRRAIVLHGGMGSAERMRSNSGFDPVAMRQGFMVVYAEGSRRPSSRCRRSSSSGST